MKMRKIKNTQQLIKLKIDKLHELNGFCNYCIPCLFKNQTNTFLIDKDLLIELEKILNIESLHQLILN